MTQAAIGLSTESWPLHFESGEGLWLQEEAALLAHSFRDAEPHPVIPQMQRKAMAYFQSSSEQA